MNRPSPVCRHCGGQLTGLNAQGASRCLSCGKGTLRACDEELECGGHCTLRIGHAEHHWCEIKSHHHDEPGPDACNGELPCGGRCYLPHGHGEACLCGGDVDGVPGTCPG